MDVDGLPHAVHLIGVGAGERVDGGAMTGPSVGRRSRRIVQPVSGVRKRLMKSLEISIARIIIAVEAEVGMGRILAVGKSPDNPYKRNRHR